MKNFKDEFTTWNDIQYNNSSISTIKLFSELAKYLFSEIYTIHYKEPFTETKKYSLESLLEDIAKSSILEIWQIKYAFSENTFRLLRVSNNAKFNMALIANKWYKDEISNNIEINHNSSTCNFSYIQQI
ncbi:523_t:CDS:2 [Funneliformis caledonium]|uniref:523_t:CDS:1 n=1 Tax=Funneliformis caledonium TaxID=1117310 RepID=A0A9N9IXD0_9GLOM|nr:523_t:CDS:2 [Funneliformis caledonium]